MMIASDELHASNNPVGCFMQNFAVGLAEIQSHDGYLFVILIDRRCNVYNLGYVEA